MIATGVAKSLGPRWCRSMAREHSKNPGEAWRLGGGRSLSMVRGEAGAELERVCVCTYRLLAAGKKALP